MTDNLSIPIIQGVVSTVSQMPIDQIIIRDKVKTARKREKTVPRMVSMYLSKQYTKHTLGYIGELHGGRDHATVLHAVKTINNLLDTHDRETVILYTKAKHNIDRIVARRKIMSDEYRKLIKFIPISKRMAIIKSCIKNNIPLEHRENIFKSLIDNNPINNGGHRTPALPGRM